MMPRAHRLNSRTPTLAEAVAAYWASGAERHLPLNTQRAFRHAHHALLDTIGPDQPVTVLSGLTPAEVLDQRGAGASLVSWNAHVTALQSLVSYSQRHGWLSEGAPALEPRRHASNETAAIPADDLAALWSRPEVPLRERLLWRLLYDTAARADEVLALDVEHLDLPHRRAVVTGKGGRGETITWGEHTAELLARYLAGRRRGPLFLTHRRSNVVPGDSDRCPATGRARLSYHRAWTIFHQVSGGWTLHQLRCSALARIGDRRDL